MIEEGEIIEIPVENPNNSTNAKQPEIGIIVLSFGYLILKEGKINFAKRQ